jgi:transglutaminase-like putative cysteine protease
VRFATLHKAVTYFFAGLGLASLFLGGELLLPIELALMVSFVASWFVDGPIIHRKSWQQGWNVTLLAILVGAVTRGLTGEPLLPLALEMTAVLQISRLSNRRSATEHQQIAILAFLHLCAATVLSTELAYGLAFLGFVVVAPWMLALTHLRSEIEGHYPGDPDPARAADVRRVLASRRVVGGSFLAGTAALSLPLFVLTGALFLVFPRVGLGLLSFDRGEGQHVAGFGDDVTLGQIGVIRDNPTVIARVSRDDAGRTPAARAALRLRGTSFDHYDGRRWSRSDRDGRSLGRIDAIYAIERMPIEGRDARWSIMLDHLDDTVVFLPEGTVAIEIPARVSRGVEVGRELTLAPGLDLRYESDDSLGLRYAAYVSRGREPPRERLTAGEAQGYLQIPEGHQRLVELARTWTAGATTDLERAERITDQLHRFAYSLEQRDPGDRPPVIPFLFEWRAGHCEYFSTALALMLRSLGIPARNVTGFLGGRWNAYGRYYAITQGDAHSWVEVWIDGEDWVTFDPTPPERSEVGLASNVWAELGAMIDALRTRWDEAVVGYDLRAQRSLARSFARWLRSMVPSRAEPEPERPEGEAGARSAAGGPSPVRWLVGVAAAVVVGLAIRALRRRRRAARSGLSAVPISAREIVALYHALDRVLGARGRARPPGRTPREHAELLAREGFSHAADVAAITDRYLDVRWGGGEIPDAELAELRARLRAIERAPASSPAS